MAPDGTLYVSDALDNRIVAIPDAATRTTSAGTGREVTKGGLLQRPLALVMLPNGHLLVVQCARTARWWRSIRRGKQIYAQWIDANQAQSPPGNGDLFGIALTPDGKGFYYVEDDMNTRDGGTLSDGIGSCRRAGRAAGLLAAAGGLCAAVGGRLRGAVPRCRRRRRRVRRSSRSGARIRAAS